MDQANIAAITIYDDLTTILEERGYTDAQITEIIMKLTAQAEIETVEEVLSGLSDDKIKVLDSLPDNASAYEIAEKLGLDGEEIDVIRAKKVAELIEQMVPDLN